MNRVLKHAAAALAVTALAQTGLQAEPLPPTPARGPISFAQMDADQDGRISAEEFAQAHQQRLARRAQQGYRLRGASQHPAFETVDADGDGLLNANELMAFRAARRDERPCRRRQGL